MRATKPRMLRLKFDDETETSMFLPTYTTLCATGTALFRKAALKQGVTKAMLARGFYLVASKKPTGLWAAEIVTCSYDCCKDVYISCAEETLNVSTMRTRMERAYVVNAKYIAIKAAKGATR